MILFVDDSMEMGYFAQGLIDKGNDVDWASNFYDAIESLEDASDEGKYSAIILDLALNNAGLPDEALDDAKMVFPGWAFYVHILKNYPSLQEKTIFLSGFPENFEEKIGGEKYSKLIVVRKGYGDIDNVLACLRGWGI
jgi:hypothetical protein